MSEQFPGVVRRATPADAAAIVANIERSYGASYCVAEARDPAATARAIESGAAVYALAALPDGRVVAQAALLRLEPGLYECGRVVVDPEQRQHGLMRAVTELLIRREAPALGARFVTAGAVTTHPYGQRNGQAFAMTPLGLLLGVYPRWSVAGFAPAHQPVSSLLFGLRIGPEPPRGLRLRGRDAERAAAVLRSLGIGCEQPPPRWRAGPLGWSLRRDPALGLGQLRLSAALPPRSLEAGIRAAVADARLAWADVPVEHADAQAAVDLLREQGFGHAAYLPLGGPAGEDVLRLQRYLGPEPLELDAVQVLPELAALRGEVWAEARPRLPATPSPEVL